VMNEAVRVRAQELLDSGYSRVEVAEELGIKYDTLRKAINQRRLHEPGRTCESAQWVADRSQGSVEDAAAEMGASDRSQRSVEDAAAEMGTACTRPGERVLAALGMLNGAPTRFEECRDVSFGGVLCALPSLAENGLFKHLECFSSLSGYYSTLHVVVLLALPVLFLASIFFTIFAVISDADDTSFPPKCYKLRSVTFCQQRPLISRYLLFASGLCWQHFGPRRLGLSEL